MGFFLSGRLIMSILAAVILALAAIVPILVLCHAWCVSRHIPLIRDQRR